jgi:hypothetical protein
LATRRISITRSSYWVSTTDSSFLSIEMKARGLFRL